MRKHLGPSYDEEQYWDERFKFDSDSFEWLGSGGILLEAFQQAFPFTTGDTSRPPRVLQLGAGTSKLSLDLARHMIDVYKSETILNSVLNLDFSHNALKIGQEQAASQGLEEMQYLHVDLRQWSELSSKNIDPIDFIMDKSTSDAISTNTNIDLTIQSRINNNLCPLLTKSKEKVSSLDPLDLVALHLAALSNPGCLWAVLSYSSTRFQIFSSPECLSQKYWKIIQKKSVPAPSGSEVPGAPSVYHWFYLLQHQS